MSPQETTALLSNREAGDDQVDAVEVPAETELGDVVAEEYVIEYPKRMERRSNGMRMVECGKALLYVGIGMILMCAKTALWGGHFSSSNSSLSSSYEEPLEKNYPTGPYALVERQEGHHFFDYYEFFDGPDSLGSAGLNLYVSKERAMELGIANVTTEVEDNHMPQDYVYMSSAHTLRGGDLRESIRLEGLRRFDHGLFILDLDHMPTGCGVWPAFWLTDEAVWPDNGEIDIVEGINVQSVAKTALHTSKECSMYAHVPVTTAMTGQWDISTGIPDTFTGQLNYVNRLESDNCYVLAPHQWANQGCVIGSKDNTTLGPPINEAGGGIYVLQWDPVNHYIRSWAFPKNQPIPDNLRGALATAKLAKPIVPDPSQWGLPYAFFAIGDTTGCSASHFKNMRLVVNLAFCGAVSGNRFLSDCPHLSDFGKRNNGNSWLSCNDYIKSLPTDVLEEAYWKIKGVYVYERTPTV